MRLKVKPAKVAEREKGGPRNHPKRTQTNRVPQRGRQKMRLHVSPLCIETADCSNGPVAMDFSLSILGLAGLQHIKKQIVAAAVREDPWGLRTS